jgi:tetratricopeptide (TPR) repeat protein
MFRNPWFMLVVGLMAGLVFGYVLAENQPVPPAKAIRLGLNPQSAQGASQGDELPEGHPPIEGDSAADTDRLRQQVAEVEGLLASNPDDAGLLAAMGNLFFDASRWPDARDWYEKSLQVSPGDPNVLTDLAVVYRNLGEPDQTIKLLDQAIAIHSDHWQAWYNKVVVYQFDLHDHGAAADALRTLQELKKNNSAIPDLSGLEQEVFGS